MDSPAVNEEHSKEQRRGKLVTPNSLFKVKRRNQGRVTKWTMEQVLSFREWHEERMNELNYPADVQQELRIGREQFLGAVLP